MKLLIVMMVLSFEASAFYRAVYGEDNRMDVFTVTDPHLQNMALPTAAMIDKTHLKKQGKQTLITGPSLGDRYKLCPNQRFRKQQVSANCSGTLVAADLIMTAGHCYEMAKQDCKNYSWVFDYKVSSADQASVTVSNSSVFSCKKVILKKNDTDAGIDHALIQLDRPVKDRPFAKLASGEIRKGDPLVLIGHPSGLPTKIAADAFILEVLTSSFKTNVDAFSVNSGSGVFHATSGEVVGILSSGRADYDGKDGCTSVLEYEMDFGNEIVMRPLEIQKYLEAL